MERIKLVVMEEHTLGYIAPGSMYLNVLHSSILKGAPFEVLPEPKLNKGKTIRLATPQDFEDYRHSFVGFDDRGKYEYVDIGDFVKWEISGKTCYGIFRQYLPDGKSQVNCVYAGDKVFMKTIDVEPGLIQLSSKEEVEAL